MSYYDNPNVNSNVIVFVVESDFIPAFSIVYLNVNGKIETADTSVAEQKGKIVGITLQDGNFGEAIYVRRRGVVENEIWNLQIGAKYYLQFTGTISDIAFNTEFIQEIGLAISNKKILLDIKEEPVSVSQITELIDGQVNHYSHLQDAESSSWIITHALNRKYVNVIISDTAGSKVEGSVTFVDRNTVQIDFSSPFSGIAYIN